MDEPFDVEAAIRNIREQAEFIDATTPDAPLPTVSPLRLDQLVKGKDVRTLRETIDFLERQPHNAGNLPLDLLDLSSRLAYLLSFLPATGIPALDELDVAAICADRPRDMSPAEASKYMRTKLGLPEPQYPASQYDGYQSTPDAVRKREHVRHRGRRMAVEVTLPPIMRDDPRVEAATPHMKRHMEPHELFPERQPSQENT